MKSKIVSMLLIASLGGISIDAVVAQSQHKSGKDAKEAHVEKHKHDKKSFKNMDEEQRAEMMRQRNERLENMSEEERAALMQQRREEMEERREMREGLEGLSEEERAEAMRARREAMDERRSEGAENDTAVPGNARAEEMRARRDERKAIKEEYRTAREPGQEGSGNDDIDSEGGTSEKSKKPWWKFWGE